MIARETIDALLASVDFVELVERSIALKKAGAIYKGLCPFHSERTASFTVFAAQRSAHCFGCGWNGNAISWVMDRNGLTFPEAVESLAQGAAFDLGAEFGPQDDSRQKREAAKLLKRQEQARIEAQTILSECDRQKHPYLLRKGFPTTLGLVHVESGDLIIPMRDCEHYDTINTLQRIDGEGNKKFLYGGKAKGSVFKLGSRGPSWLCEGAATSYSVLAAANELRLQTVVVACFSADNLRHVAERMKGPKFVFADNDLSGVGEQAAIATGLPWCMPPRHPGMKKADANDLMLSGGIRAVADLMRHAQDKAAGYE